MRVCSTSLALALLAFHAAEAVVLQPRVRAPLFPSPHALRCLSSSVRLAAEPSETEAAAGDGAVPDGEGMSDAKAEKAAKKAEKDALRAQIDELEKKLTSARGDFVAAQDEAKDAGENGYLLLAANFERERQRARTELDGQAGYGRLEAMRPLLPFVEQFAALQAEADGADGGAAEVHKYYSGIHKQLTQAMGEPRRPPLCLCSLTARTPPLQVLEAAQLEPFDSAPGDAYDWRSATHLSTHTPRRNPVGTHASTHTHLPTQVLRAAVLARVGPIRAGGASVVPPRLASALPPSALLPSPLLTLPSGAAGGTARWRGARARRLQRIASSSRRREVTPWGGSCCARRRCFQPAAHTRRLPPPLPTACPTPHPPLPPLSLPSLGRRLFGLRRRRRRCRGRGGGCCGGRGCCGRGCSCGGRRGGGRGWA